VPPSQNPQSLKPQQAQNMMQAAQKGNLDQFLAKHPKIAAQQQAVTAGGGAKQQKFQGRVQGAQAKAGQGAPATGASGGKGAAPPAAPPPGNPAAGAGGGKNAAPAAAPPAAAPAADNTFAQGFNAQFGKGAMDQFGNMGWYGANPIETAWKAGQQGLQKDLAGIRERFGQGGMGTSSRNLLSQESAAQDFETQFADKAAQLGLGARENDLNRLATMFAGAGEQQLAGKAQELQANQQLANLGTGITAIGAQEQGIPNLAEMGTILANFGNVQGRSRGAMNPPAK
jgi:hypothetical protein